MKKIISMMLVVAMVITFMMPVMASEQNLVNNAIKTSEQTSADNALANAIKTVKEKIEIPNECNKFQYYINSDNGLLTWDFDWTNEKDGKRISVTIDEKNIITRYYLYDGSISYDKKIPKYSEEQAQKIAEKFINKIDDKLLEQYKLIEKTNSYINDREYIFDYVRNVNGIKFDFDNISICVNKYTGVVSYYTCRYSSDANFEDASKIISNEQATKAFIDKLGLKMVYKVKKEDNKQVSYLVYVPKYSDKYIDAITGEVENTPVNFLRDQMQAKFTSLNMAVGSAGDTAVSLTPEEMDAVKSMTGVMSKEDVDKKVRGISLFGIDNGYKISNASLNKDWTDNESFKWYLNYTKEISNDKVNSISVQIDAKSGEIQSFSFYGDFEKGTKPRKTKEEAKAICYDALKSLFSTKYDKLKLDDSYSDSSEKNEQENFSFRFARMENGIECYDDCVEISYNNDIGIISNISCNWNKSVIFEAPKDTLPIDKVYDILFDKIGYEVKYIREFEDMDDYYTWNNQSVFNGILGYFIKVDKPTIISATTGDILDYSGKVYKENVIVDYTDIDGLKNENEIKILTKMSIRYIENELKPNEKLLQKDYFILLNQLNNQYYFEDTIDDEDIEAMYSSLINLGIITKEEKAPMSELTREEAAKYFVRFLGYKNIAEIKGIYKSNFKDANKITPDLLGYVCIASGLKAMNGNKGYFYPKNKMTRLEGLLSIYSYLSNK